MTELGGSHEIASHRFQRPPQFGLTTSDRPLRGSLATRTSGRNSDRTRLGQTRSPYITDEWVQAVYSNPASLTAEQKHVLQLSDALVEELVRSEEHTSELQSPCNL